MLVRILVEVDNVQCFPLLWIGKRKKKQYFDIKCHDSYLMKCLHNDISQNDTICCLLNLTHLVSNIKTTSSQ